MKSNANPGVGFLFTCLAVIALFTFSANRLRNQIAEKANGLSNPAITHIPVRGKVCRKFGFPRPGEIWVVKSSTRLTDSQWMLHVFYPRGKYFVSAFSAYPLENNTIITVTAVIYSNERTQFFMPLTNAEPITVFFADPISEIDRAAATKL